MNFDIDQVKHYIEEKDMLIHQFGMEILEVTIGRAAVSMEVRPEHLNAAGFCHGGVIFSLADVAFALACNSHGTMALALDVSISYLRPCVPGDRLVARAEEEKIGKRTGLYIIKVTNSESKKVAILKATAFRMGEPFRAG